MKKSIAITRWAWPAIMATMLAILSMWIFFGRVAFAAPYEWNYANHATSPTGITVAVEGTMYANWHNHRDLPGGTVNGVYDACGSGVNYPEQFANYGMMVRGKLTVTDVATGETYRTRGHWVTGGDARVVARAEVCAGVWTIYWDDAIDIITPTAVMPYRLTFEAKVSTETGDLIGVDVYDAELQ